MGMTKAARIVAPLLLAVGAAVFPGSLFAQQESVPQQQEVAPPRFDINRFEVVGNTILPAEEVDRLVFPYTGKNKDFADIQRALESLEQAFRDRGFGVVQILLPEQDITRGVVQFRVLQPKIGKVTVEGNSNFNTENVLRSLPSVKPGETPNSANIARNLQLTAEHPIKQTNVLLRSGETEDVVDVNVKVTDDRPWRRFFSLDNTGTGDTGYFRAGIGFQHTNLFNRDHSLTAQYVTSPTNASKVSIYGAGYRIPFYELNSSLDLVAGYSDVNSGVVQGLFNVAGSGTIAAARWNYILPKWADLDQKLAVGLDYRAFSNQVVPTGQTQNLSPDITVHPISLNYNGLKRMTAADFSFYAGVAHNIPGGSDGTEADWRNAPAARQAVNDDYTLLRYGFNYARQFRNEWQMRVALNGQYSSDALVPGEQFGLGGPDSVRGYLLREVANDRGYSMQNELYTPDFARKVGLSDTYNSRALLFYDWGAVQRNKGVPGDVMRDSLASWGLGLRLTYRKMVNLRFDVAQILQATPNREANSVRVSGSLAVVF
jgi:hemolysin activation/secretion protein